MTGRRQTGSPQEARRCRSAAAPRSGTRRQASRGARGRRSPAVARRAARLTERRIGLLFAVFLAMLAFAGLRAGYLLAFKGGELKRARRHPAGART